MHPASPTMKSCLKCATPPRSPTKSTTPEPALPALADDDGRPALCKHVSFREFGTEQVFIADEWDRTPMDPAKKLSYADVLELKQLHSQLPRAEQAPETAAYMPRYLKSVPIHLLPLLPAAEPPKLTSARDMFKAALPRGSAAPTSSPVSSPFARSPLASSPAGSRASSPRVTSARDMFAKPGAHPPSPPTTPPPPPAVSPPPARRRMLNMAFLPLLPPAEPTPVADPPEAVSPAMAASDDATYPAAIEHNLPTPSSTPALTTRALESEPEPESSMPVALPAAAATGPDAGPPSPKLSPSRRRAPGMLQVQLDQFPTPPTGLPPPAPGSAPSTATPSQTTFTDAPPGPPSPHSPVSAFALSRRLANLGAAPSPGPSASSGGSTPSAYSSSTVSSAGTSCDGGDGSYFGLPMRAVPPHLRRGAGEPLPDSPFVDPLLMGPRRAAPTSAYPESPFVDPMLAAGMGAPSEMGAAGRGVPPLAAARAAGFASSPARAEQPLPPLALPTKARRGLRLEGLPSPSLAPPSPLLLGGTVSPTGHPHEPALVPLPPPVPADGLI